MLKVMQNIAIIKDNIEFHVAIDSPKNDQTTILQPFKGVPIKSNKLISFKILLSKQL